MSSTNFTTISWRTLYDQAVAKEPKVPEVAYRFTGKTFSQEEPAYGWREAQKGIYTLGDWRMNESWDELG